MFRIGEPGEHLERVLSKKSHYQEQKVVFIVYDLEHFQKGIQREERQGEQSNIKRMKRSAKGLLYYFTH